MYLSYCGSLYIRDNFPLQYTEVTHTHSYVAGATCVCVCVSLVPEATLCRLTPMCVNCPRGSRRNNLRFRDPAGGSRADGMLLICIIVYDTLKISAIFGIFCFICAHSR